MTESTETPQAMISEDNVTYITDVRFSTIRTGCRDIHWCHMLNEPMIIEYRERYPHCVNCNWTDKDAILEKNMPKFSEPFASNHTFLLNIFKPHYTIIEGELCRMLGAAPSPNKTV